MPTKSAKKKRSRPVVERILRWMLVAGLIFYGLICIALLFLRSVDPAFTAVQLERRVSASLSHEPYEKHYAFRPLEKISPHLQHAVVAAEDARFYHHHGFDWREIGSAIDEGLKDGRQRGASTITQQLARNLFLSTNRSVVRKGVEFSIVPLVEAILSKKRILELYLNVIEWGPGIYGAEAATEHYFGNPANRLTREQAAELAEILPAPLHRKPDHLSTYGARILERMRQMGN